MVDRDKELRTGLAVVIGLIILTGFVIFSGSFTFLHDYYQVKVKFESAAGVKKGAPVRVAGVEIGNVEDIAFKVAANKEIYIEMILQLEKGYLISTDSTVAITSDSLLGERFLEITPGVTQAYLAPGETLPRKGSTPKSLDEALEMVPPIVDSLKIGIDNLNEIIADPKFQSDIRAAVKNFASASSNATELLKDIRIVIEENREDIKATIHNASLASENMKEFVAKLSDIEKEFTETISMFRKEFTAFAAKINDPEIFEKIKSTIEMFSKLPDETSKLIATFRELGEEDTKNVLSKANETIEELRVTILQMRQDLEEAMASLKLTLELTREGEGLIPTLLTNRLMTRKFSDMLDQGVYLLEHPIMFILKGGYKERKEPPEPKKEAEEDEDESNESETKPERPVIKPKTEKK